MFQTLQYIQDGLDWLNGSSTSEDDEGNESQSDQKSSKNIESVNILDDIQNLEIESNTTNNDENKGPRCSIPNTSEVLLRCERYLETFDQADKITSNRKAIMKTIGIEILCDAGDFESRETPTNIYLREDSKFYNLVHENPENHYFFMTVMITSIRISAVLCFELTPERFKNAPKNWQALWKTFLNSSDEVKNNIFKLFPKVSEAPMLAQITLDTIMPNRPILAAKRCPSNWIQHHNVLELDLEADVGPQASIIMKIIYPLSTFFTFDLCFILQSERKEELPECIFSAIQVHDVDFSLYDIQY